MAQMESSKELLLSGMGEGAGHRGLVALPTGVNMKKSLEKRLINGGTRGEHGEGCTNGRLNKNERRWIMTKAVERKRTQ